MKKKIIEIKNLKVSFLNDGQLMNAVKDSSFIINEGECFSIVGESGSGKSVTAMSMMRLIQENAKTKISGSINFKNKNLLKLSEVELSK